MENGYSRRTFLKGAAFATTGALAGFTTLAGCAPQASGQGGVQAATEGTPFENTVEWDAEYDVIVCGFGASGACAAIGAADNGAKVLLLEKGDATLAGGELALRAELHGLHRSRLGHTVHEEHAWRPYGGAGRRRHRIPRRRLHELPRLAHRPWAARRAHQVRHAPRIPRSLAQRRGHRGLPQDNHPHRRTLRGRPAQREPRVLHQRHQGQPRPDRCLVRVLCRRARARPVHEDDPRGQDDARRQAVHRARQERRGAGHGRLREQPGNDPKLHRLRRDVREGLPSEHRRFGRHGRRGGRAAVAHGEPGCA